MIRKYHNHKPQTTPWHRKKSRSTTWEPEGGGGLQGVWTSPEKSQNIGFRRNTGPEPLKNLKATKPAFNSGPSSARQQNAI